MVIMYVIRNNFECYYIFNCLRDYLICGMISGKMRILALNLPLHLLKLFIPFLAIFHDRRQLLGNIFFLYFDSDHIL